MKMPSQNSLMKLFELWIRGKIKIKNGKVYVLWFDFFLYLTKSDIQNSWIKEPN